MPHECPQEERIRALEDYRLTSKTEFNNLLSRFDGLITILRKLAYIGLGIIFTMLGSLIVYWVKG